MRSVLRFKQSAHSYLILFNGNHPCLISTLAQPHSKVIPIFSSSSKASPNRHPALTVSMNKPYFAILHSVNRFKQSVHSYLILLNGNHPCLISTLAQPHRKVVPIFTSSSKASPNRHPALTVSTNKLYFAILHSVNRFKHSVHSYLILFNGNHPCLISTLAQPHSKVIPIFSSSSKASPNRHPALTVSMNKPYFAILHSVNRFKQSVHSYLILFNGNHPCLISTLAQPHSKVVPIFTSSSKASPNRHPALTVSTNKLYFAILHSVNRYKQSVHSYLILFNGNHPCLISTLA